MGDEKGNCDQLFGGPMTDDLSSIVAAAHELKSPLALIRQLSLMLDSDDKKTTDECRILRQIILTSERALRLTSDLTKSVRLDDALFKLEPINPNQICKDVVHEMSPLYAAHNRRLRFVSNHHSRPLIANRDLLRRVIMNFSDNALNYSEGDEVVEIKVTSIKNGSAVRLGVRDYGPALPGHVFRSIKNQSLISASSIHSRPQSSGLGVYITSQFADAMNGKIGVTRHRDGVTFYIELQASRQLSLL